jgi:hypothetical protein
MCILMCNSILRMDRNRFRGLEGVTSLSLGTESGLCDSTT